MSALRKVTLNLPSDLLDGAMKDSGKGLTETIREALEARRRERALSRLLALKGKSRITESWEELRGKYDEEKDWR